MNPMNPSNTYPSTDPSRPKTPYRLKRLGIVMQGDLNNPDEAMGVLNPATARSPKGKLYLFPRVVASGNYSRIGIAQVLFDAQGDPVDVKRLGYVLEPSESYERNEYTAGCEDPRITFVELLGLYVMTYTAYGPVGPRIAIAISKDVLTWQRIGPAKFAFMPQYRVDFDLYDNKDAYLFPRPVQDPHGKPALAMIHRPSNWQGRGHQRQILPEGVTEPRASMWISYCSLELAQRDSSALLTWRDHCLLATSAHVWEHLKIGGGTPPVLTAQGWLTIYHGVSGRILENVDHQSQVHYAAGAMLLDVDDPRKILYRSTEPILSAEVEAEREGVVPNVVFPTGVDVRKDKNGETGLDVYYGMADSSIGVARMKLAM
jgi:beta-1,2-mannobiose phosphorylase / 1,2-beta-oligomannan phosphorylase